MFQNPFELSDLLTIMGDEKLMEEFAELTFNWQKEVMSDFFFTIFKVFTFQRSLWNKRRWLSTIFYGILYWTLLISFIGNCFS